MPVPTLSLGLRCYRFQTHRNAQFEFTVHGLKRCSHIVLRYKKRNAALRRPLRDCENIYVIAVKGGKHAPDNSGYAAQLFSDYSDDCNIRIESDVFHSFECQL